MGLLLSTLQSRYINQLLHGVPAAGAHAAANSAQQE